MASEEKVKKEGDEAEQGSQEQADTDGATSNASSYSSLAQKTMANIRRLQENVQASTTSPGSGSTTVSIRGAVRCDPNSSPSGGSNTTTVWVGNHQSPENVQQVLSPTFPQQPMVSSSFKSSTQTAPTPPQSPLPSISPTLTSSFNALVTINPNWQSSKKSVRERNAVMCNNALMANVYFNVGSDLGPAKKFPAHKYVLATGSTVFYAMFFGGLADDKEVIDVPDVEPVAFLTMLRYLYCDEVILDNDNVLATLYCAKRYIVPYLAQECVNFLERHLSAKNACVMLSQSRLFEEPDLMERSWEVIDAQSQLALLSESFSDVDRATLKEVLSRETLNCKETVVFQAALNWASAVCANQSMDGTPEQKREILGDLLRLVRFPAMNVQEFADDVVKSKILTLQETTDIFMHFTAKNKPDIEYPIKARRGLQMQVCHRFQSSAYRSNQWRYRGRCDAIQFCVDRRIFIVGFGLYGSSNGSSNYSAKISLKNTNLEKENSTLIQAENICKFVSDGSSNTFKVFFDQPVQVEADIFYTASVILDGDELSYFGQEGLSEVSSSTVTFQFQASSESTNGTGVQGGQIPELLFYGPTTQD